MVRASQSEAHTMIDTYFAMFGLPQTFELDIAELNQRYREAVKQVHPDRFATASDQEQRAAVERAASLNTAHQVLKSTTQRALYLLNLQEPLDEEATVQDPEFLLQQMEWREELEDLADLSAIDAFKSRLLQARRNIDEGFAQVWQDSALREQAVRLVRRMQFLDKVLAETRQLEERLDDF